MTEIIIKIVMGILLFTCGVQDVMQKKVYLWSIGLGGLFISICIPFRGSFSLIDTVGGIAVGICVVIISIVTEGKIGLGDGMLLCITGLGLGFWSNLELFGIALFLAAVLSILLLIFRLADRKKSIPFIPFLFLGYVLLMISDTKVGF